MDAQQIARFKNKLIKMDLGEYTDMGKNDYEVFHMYISTKNNLSMWIAYTSLGDFKMSYIDKDIQNKSIEMQSKGEMVNGANIYSNQIKRFKTKKQKEIFELIDIVTTK